MIHHAIDMRHAKDEGTTYSVAKERFRALIPPLTALDSRGLWELARCAPPAKVDRGPTHAMQLATASHCAQFSWALPLWELARRCAPPVRGGESAPCHACHAAYHRRFSSRAPHWHRGRSQCASLTYNILDAISQIFKNELKSVKCFPIFTIAAQPRLWIPAAIPIRTDNCGMHLDRQLTSQQNHKKET